MGSLSDMLLDSVEYEKFATKVLGHRPNSMEKRTLAAAIGLGMSYGYYKIAGYQAKYNRGNGYSEKDNMDAGVEGVNNVGFAHAGPPEPTFFRKNSFQINWDEGGPMSRFSNNVFGVNAVAGVHDEFQVNLENWGGAGARSSLFNPLGMIGASLITAPALLWSPTLLFRDELEREGIKR
jgi:hypothetical protein